MNNNITRWSPWTKRQLKDAIRKGGNSVCQELHCKTAEVRFEMSGLDLLDLMNFIEVATAERFNRPRIIFRHEKKNFFCSATEYRCGAIVCVSMERRLGKEIAHGAVRVIFYRSNIDRKILENAINEEYYLRWIA